MLHLDAGDVYHGGAPFVLYVDGMILTLVLLRGLIRDGEPASKAVMTLRMVWGLYGGGVRVKLRVASTLPFAMLLVVFPSGCKQAVSTPASTTAAAADPAVKAAPPTPLAEKKEDLGSDNPWSPALDAYIEKHLPPDLLSAQAAQAVRSVCPAFAAESDVDKRAFWAYTMQAMAASEAGLKPTADVHHTQSAVAKTDKVTHRPIRQEGLLQLTYEDADRYGCGFDWASDSRLPEKDPRKTILQPENNLQCGMKILDNQIITQGKPLLVRSSYWATLQPGTQSYRVFAKQMANVPAACGTHVRQTGKRERRD